MKQEDKNILEYFFNELKFPEILGEFEDPDFVYDNSYIAGIVSQVLNGKNIKKYSCSIYLDERDAHFQNVINSSKSGVERDEVIHYFEAYKQVIEILKSNM